VNSRAPLVVKKATIFRFSLPYYSIAFKCWRVEVHENTLDGTWQTEHVAYLEIERKEDADAIAVLLPAMKKFSDFEFLISTVKEKVMQHSTTKGTVFAWSPNHRGIPLHKADG
jgi:hypothetical protein